MDEFSESKFTQSHGDEIDNKIPVEVLSSIEIREKLADLRYLPKFEEIRQAFTDEQELSEYMYNNGIYEFINQEYVAHLSQYIIEAAIRLRQADSQPIAILEVGAGNGRLTHFLQEAIERTNPGLVKIVAVDTGEWKIKPTFPVVETNHQQAIKLYNPKIIISSWMPPNIDLSQDFRDTENVEEYILIGDSEACGKLYDTWALDPDNLAPSEKDGFGKRELQSLSNFQLGKSDQDLDWFLEGDKTEHGKQWHTRSETVSFRRMGVEAAGKLRQAELDRWISGE